MRCQCGHKIEEHDIFASGVMKCHGGPARCDCELFSRKDDESALPRYFGYQRRQPPTPSESREQFEQHVSDVIERRERRRRDVAPPHETVHITGTEIERCREAERLAMAEFNKKYREYLNMYRRQMGMDEVA